MDRDGVINRKAPTEDEYITRWEQMQIFPGVVEAIVLLRRAGFRIIVVSNQRCVASGLTTTNEVDSLHQQMIHVLEDNGAKIDAVYYCPHALHAACGCRKPMPGMLLEAAREHHIDLTKSWMIGDSDIDVKAGINAGCKTVRIMRASGETSNCNANLEAMSLVEAVHTILKQEASAGTWTTANTIDY